MPDEDPIALLRRAARLLGQRGEDLPRMKVILEREYLVGNRLVPAVTYDRQHPCERS